MGHETGAAELDIDLAESRLSPIERDERHFGLNDNDILQALTAITENRQLRPLNVNLDEIDHVDLGNVIDPPRHDGRLTNHLAPFRKAGKMPKRRWIRRKQARH